MKTADNNSRSARPTARMNKFSQIKNIIPLAISICLLVPLFYYQDLNFDLFSFFNIKLFSIFIVICMLVSSVGSVRLYANLKSFYNGITLRVVHKINAYSMVSGLFFAGMIGATVTKITLPALGKANKSLVILISIVEKSITFGIMFIIGMASVLKLNNQNLLAVINMPGEFDLLMLIAASLVIVFLFLRTYILEYVRLVAVFLPNTILFSVLIVLLNLIPPYLVLNNILEVSFFQKILYATALMFIGSLPISFKGIGAREVAATILLSQYELSSSVIIGNVLMLSFSEIVAIILLPITTISFGSVTRTFEEKKNKLLENALNYIENNMMLISIPCILLCLFETKIFILNNPVSVTFGDFFAIFLSFTLIGLFFEKNIDPALRRIFILLLSIFSYFCFCFVVGFMDFGFSEWAFYNKLLGGFVLLGYVHAGFLFARLDKQTIQKVFRFIIIIMSVYLLIFLALNRFELGGKGFYLDTVFKKFNSLVFLGPVSNPVAFAFMAGIFIIIFYMFAHIGILKERFFAFSVFISTFCLGLTRCRTGIVAVAFVLFPLLFVAARPLRKALAVSVISGLILSLGLVHAAFLSNQTAKFSKERILQAEGVERIDEGTFFFVSKSDIKREETNLLAWDLFKQNWFFGAGLGATYKYSDKILEHPSIANNTLLLYLADTGLTGIVFILLFFYYIYSLILKNEDKAFSFGPIFWAAVLFCLAFSMMHDISYQRFFWIWIGMIAGVVVKPLSYPVFDLKKKQSPYHAI